MVTKKSNTLKYPTKKMSEPLISDKNNETDVRFRFSALCRTPDEYLSAYYSHLTRQTGYWYWSKLNRMNQTDKENFVKPEEFNTRLKYLIPFTKEVIPFNNFYEFYRNKIGLKNDSNKYIDEFHGALVKKIDSHLNQTYNQVKILQRYSEAGFLKKFSGLVLAKTIQYVENENRIMNKMTKSNNEIEKNKEINSLIKSNNNVEEEKEIIKWLKNCNNENIELLNEKEDLYLITPDNSIVKRLKTVAESNKRTDYQEKFINVNLFKKQKNSNVFTNFKNDSIAIKNGNIIGRNIIISAEHTMNIGNKSIKILEYEGKNILHFQNK